MKPLSFVLLVGLATAGSALAVAQGRHSDRAAAWWLGVQHMDERSGLNFEQAKPCIKTQWDLVRGELPETQEQAWRAGRMTAEACLPRG